LINNQLVGTITSSIGQLTALTDLCVHLSIVFLDPLTTISQVPARKQIEWDDTGNHWANGVAPLPVRLQARFRTNRNTPHILHTRHLARNRLSGIIPTTITQLTVLQELYVAINAVSRFDTFVSGT
jgi:hypothetical protein